MLPSLGSEHHSAPFVTRHWPPPSSGRHSAAAVIWQRPSLSSVRRKSSAQHVSLQPLGEEVDGESFSDLGLAMALAQTEQDSLRDSSAQRKSWENKGGRKMGLNSNKMMEMALAQVKRDSLRDDNSQNKKWDHGEGNTIIPKMGRRGKSTGHGRKKEQEREMVSLVQCFSALDEATALAGHQKLYAGQPRSGEPRGEPTGEPLQHGVRQNWRGR